MIGGLMALGIAAIAPAFPIATAQDIPPAPNQAPAPTTPSLAADAFLQAGIDHYDAERFAEAIATWQAALDAYTMQGDRLYQALVLSNLSLAHQHLGQWHQAEQTIGDSLALLVENTPSQPLPAYFEIYGKALNAKGRLDWSRDRPEDALNFWQQAEAAYHQAGYTIGILGSRINQAQVLQSLGFNQRAREVLSRLGADLEQYADTSIKALGLRNLGNALRRIGELEESQKVLKHSLAIANQSAASQSATLLDLGNTERALGNQAAAIGEASESHFDEAIEAYAESAEKAPFLLNQIKAHANRLSLLVEMDRLNEARLLWNAVQFQLPQLPLSRTAIYGQLNLIQSLSQFNKKQSLDAGVNLISWEAIANLTAQTVQQAEQLTDQRAKAYALGQLGNVYEQTQQWQAATDLTLQAVQLAEELDADDIQYRWEWQLGRILQKSGKEAEAVHAYEEATRSLKRVRSNLLRIDSEVQFSFRDNVEPLYREFADLLLQGENPSPRNLRQATEQIDALQLAELENFLRCNILDTVDIAERISDLGEAAVFYPIVLPDRLEVLLILPNQTIQRHTIAIPQYEFDRVVGDWAILLKILSRANRAKTVATQLYEWMIQPFETFLEADQSLETSSIKTLVFVLDGALRNIPMGALRDGLRDRYLIERYAIAVAPGLQLVDPTPLSRPIRILTAGSTEPLPHPFRNSAFPALESVQDEMKRIRELIPRTDELLNQAFTMANLESQLSRTNYSILHFATHGVFSSNPARTYIALTDTALFSEDLDALVRANDLGGSNIQMIVFSACQTAAGDDRATLGLAGLTVRAGARSALATLWDVNDEATAVLMGRFYEELVSHPSISRSEALRRAQVSFLRTEENLDFENFLDWPSPFYWSPFVIVGNWL
ncbi:MAG: CHAT domain-containing protein [Synechococcales bacterium]|nr:CHAT domain-containing protein [Synechococcales bacterium]